MCDPNSPAAAAIFLDQDVQDAPPVHVLGDGHAGNVQEGRGEINVEDGLLADRAGLEPGTPNEERDLDVHIEGEGLALDQAELTQVLSLIHI